MKRGLSLLLLITALLLYSCEKAPKDELVVWTYDSFVSEWGPASVLGARFTEETGIPLTFVSKGDGGALLAAVMEKESKPKVDVVIGLDNLLASRALDEGIFTDLKLENLEFIDKKLLLDPKLRLVPYDFGHFAFIWDSESTSPPPESLEDLLDPKYRKQIILMDPRTSTPGLGFLAWTEAVYGDAWESYWEKLSPSVLAMTPGWDTGYGLFTKGEAPLVLSYSTSPAYHKAYENSIRYKALSFKEGHPAQIELAGVPSWSKRKKDAQKFIDFLISAEAQEILPETQWMYPASQAAKLPESFSVVPELTLLDATVKDIKNDPDKAASALTKNSR